MTGVICLCINLYEPTGHFPRVSCYNTAAGNPLSGISRRLGSKIVRHVMNNYCAPKHINRGKSLRIDSQPRISIAGQQRGQVSGMVRVRTIPWIKMAPCRGKCLGLRSRSPASFSLVDMQSKELASLHLAGQLPALH